MNPVILCAGLMEGGIYSFLALLLPRRVLKRLMSLSKSESSAERKLIPVAPTFRSMVDQLPIPTVLLSSAAQVGYANQAAQRLLTSTDAMALLDLLALEEQKSLLDACANHKAFQLALTLHYPSTTQQSQTSRAVQLQLIPMPEADGQLQAIIKDISEYQQANRLPVHFHQVMQQTEDLIMVTDSHGRIVYINPAFLQQTGYTEAEVLGQNPRILSSGEHDAQFYREMWHTLRSGRSYRSTFINRRRCGETFHEEKTITPIRDEFGQISHFVSTGRDISELLNSEERLNDLRRYDPLTRLPNRQRLAEQFEQHVLLRRRTPMALFLLDLDRLSRINDSLGRAAGDQLLKLVSNRLKEKLGKQFVGRLGSDAFLVMAEGIQTPDQAAQMAQQLQKIMMPPFALTQAELFMSASLGITLYPFDGDQFDELINKAESAMHRCKSTDQGFGFFTEDLTIQTQNRVRLENQLRQALLHKEFHLVFQPRIDLTTGQVKGVEALLRWVRSDGKMVSPADFIPVLEEMGLITSVGEWVLLRACHYASQWVKQGYNLEISVNLSARQLKQPKLVEMIERCLTLTGLPAEHLELELTETSMLEEVEYSIEQLQKVRALGIKIAIDDFGTGYSSLAYLKRLPVNTLKIDRAFVKELEQDSNDINIVRAITQLAHSLQLSVTAEGIETPRQLALLKSLGCNEGQGFLLAKPMTEVDLLHHIKHFDMALLMPVDSPD
ncbi:PAS domain S-box-containing protein/diguanylate cyclase (GGDEF) domain-containing protein [Oceanospirillum multiglobuliferum]|nr:PAS domain S-box-containing protein/diguanylate cyclase (GGDEF) domain-containing protein [Oceanospirillum multiglobuliferum]